METIYQAETSGKLTAQQERILAEDEVAYIHDKIGLHRICNPDRELPAISLHLYSPSISQCKVYNENSATQVVEACAFDSVKGAPINMNIFR